MQVYGHYTGNSQTEAKIIGKYQNQNDSTKIDPS